MKNSTSTRRANNFLEDYQSELKKKYSEKIKATRPNSSEEDKVAQSYDKAKKSLIKRFFNL